MTAWPATVQPQPLLRPGAYPALDAGVHLLSQCGDVGMPIARWLRCDWLVAGDAKPCRPEPLDMRQSKRSAYEAAAGAVMAG